MYKLFLYTKPPLGDKRILENGADIMELETYPEVLSFLKKYHIVTIFWRECKDYIGDTPEGFRDYKPLYAAIDAGYDPGIYEVVLRAPEYATISMSEQDAITN